MIKIQIVFHGIGRTVTMYHELPPFMSFPPRKTQYISFPLFNLRLSNNSIEIRKVEIPSKENNMLIFSDCF